MYSIDPLAKVENVIPEVFKRESSSCKINALWMPYRTIQA